MKIHWRLGQSYTACERKLDNVLFTQTDANDVTCKLCQKWIDEEKRRKWAVNKLKIIRENAGGNNRNNL